MGQHKKVGILTFHKCINYGSYWQARCLVEGLSACEHEVELLDHDCGRVRRAEAKCALQPKLPQRTPSQELPLYRAKARKFADVIAKLPHRSDQGTQAVDRESATSSPRLRPRAFDIGAMGSPTD